MNWNNNHTSHLFYGAKLICPVINKSIAIIPNIKKDDDRINDSIGSTFFFVFFAIPIIEMTMPIPVSTNGIESPAKMPIFVI